MALCFDYFFFFVNLIFYFLLTYILYHRGVRPFGCSLLLAGIDERGPQVFLLLS